MYPPSVFTAHVTGRHFRVSMNRKEFSCQDMADVSFLEAFLLLIKNSLKSVGIFVKNHPTLSVYSNCSNCRVKLSIYWIGFRSRIDDFPPRFLVMITYVVKKLGFHMN